MDLGKVKEANGSVEVSGLDSPVSVVCKPVCIFAASGTPGACISAPDDPA